MNIDINEYSMSKIDFSIFGNWDFRKELSAIRGLSVEEKQVNEG